MKLSEFDYALPKELIAQYPAECREKCRLMVLDRSSNGIGGDTFENITGFFNKGDCVVFNDTKVIPARLFGKRKTGGNVELFLLEKKEPICEALVRPSARIDEGERIILESGDEVEILGRGQIGRLVRFYNPINAVLGSAGHTPLPPYINRADTASDMTDYQTVYAKNEGATASPTAGLHFTHDILDAIKAKGVDLAYLTLHTNYGTFAPVKTVDIENHKMHNEYFEIPANTIASVKAAKSRCARVFAVGTTSARVLEHCANTINSNNCEDVFGYTNLFIYPGFTFKVVDCLITNFHLPKSTLMLLVSAFAGREFMLSAYKHAVEKKYRFFSYGDAMIIL